MTLSTSHPIREQFERCLAVIRQASVEILLLLNVHVSEGKDPRWFLEQLDTARLGLGGWGAVAKQLNLNDAEMSEFTLQLRLLQQRVPQYESGQDVTENQRIVAVRFVTALEHLRLQQPLLTYSTDLAPGSDVQQQQAHKQVRAIELMIKGLIQQAWPDQVRLNNHLKTLFNADRVRRWLKLGDINDVLSGMMFSELAQLLVDKKEFSRYYASLFSDPTMLTLLVEPRKTLQTFLDDIRQIRNCITVQQSLSSAQLMLLDGYYAQIARPVQRAFEEGRTRINPAGLLSVDASELHDFWEKAQKMDRVTGGDLFEVRDTIEKPTQRAPRTPEQREQIISGVLWGAVGVMVIAIVAGGFWLVTSGKPQPAAVNAAETPPPQEMREMPSSRETLTKAGVTWDENNFRSAINRNDTRVALLFLQGGMDWKLSWTEEAMAAGHDDVLELMLRYRNNMTEEKPCRRFINTLSHAMANGGSLTLMRKQYLQAFCTVPAVVKRQQHDADMATRRAKSQPDAATKKWQSIQTAIYEVIR
ncbi:STY4199 family HEPN domain-containing protein [Enterobacter huaxiensis]|uniref:STY4199 family HEPN domain-containing protein n=1 Tax=Enterobacter huaxiensis TaxID=2494702 RepID=A0ABU6EUC7_9ENTR|nr:STY4199 family HEPN domain-containing protein [Enterobacter huaxiensis]MEB7544684.1 STY4199 family HEPN domain-containing protein [Enterobacter huaxiensis]MEB7582981.1 STY4199 family HEPN domain-containing protein [Enterobacter huaxiensis]MEB7665136.1 STY4199 family HEPN domain-containing protein [Enterobacter huaxiensis]